MAWSYPLATEETDWAEWGFRLEFFEATLERLMTIGHYNGYGKPTRAIDETIDGSDTEPPAAPGTGDRWAVLDGATGDWAGQDGDIAEWDGAAWGFETPDNWTLVDADGTILETDTGAWIYLDAQDASSGNFAYRTLSPRWVQDRLWDLINANQWIANTTDIDGYTGATRPVPITWPELLNGAGVDAAGQPDGEVYAVGLNSPPMPYYQNRRYAIGNSATGDWTGQDGKIATAYKDEDGNCQSGQYGGATDWAFETPNDDDVVSRNTIDSSLAYYEYDSGTTAWSPVSPALGFTRKYLREIERQNDAGSNGQRARLTGYDGHNSWQDNKHAPSGTVRTSPPDTPQNPSYWGVQAGATGAWAGQDGKIAKWDGTAWSFIAPTAYDQYYFRTYLSATPTANRASEIWFPTGSVWTQVDGSMYEHDGADWSLAVDQASDPDLITTYGFMQDGDLLGPWIFTELRAALNMLTRRTHYRPGHWGGMKTWKEAWGGMYSTWTDAKYWTNWLWNDDPPTTPYDSTWLTPAYDRGPYARSDGFQNVGGGMYGGSVERMTKELRGEFPTPYDSRQYEFVDCHFYIIGGETRWYGSLASNPFTHNDNGDTPQANGTAVRWTAASKLHIRATTNYITPRWAAGAENAIPAWCDPPGRDPSHPVEGYEIVDSWMTEEHAGVAGGYIYTA